MRGEVLRYLGWQIRDRTATRVIACLVITASFTLPIYVASRNSPLPPTQVGRVLNQMFDQLALLYALVLASGLIAQDRVQGWYRFYLAKPVSPVWFYAQAIILALVGMIVASAGFMAIVSLAVAPFWSWQILAEGATTFVLVGMIAIVWSSLLKQDWIAALITVLLCSFLRTLFENRDGFAGAAMRAVLPPLHLMDFEPRATAVQFLWIAAWGVGLLMLALTILHRRPMGED